MIYNCKHCGKPCIELSDDAIEALELTDGSGSWHVVHIACAKRERDKRKKAEGAK